MRRSINIPIFYTCNDTNIDNTVKSLRSIMENASGAYDYTVCILHNGISCGNMQQMFELNRGGFNITLEDVSAFAKSGELSSEFACSFIPRMFPGYDKSVLVSSDYVATGDISAYFDGRIAGESLFTIGC